MPFPVKIDLHRIYIIPDGVGGFLLLVQYIMGQAKSVEAPVLKAYIGLLKSDHFIALHERFGVEVITRNGIPVKGCLL